MRCGQGWGEGRWDDDDDNPYRGELFIGEEERQKKDITLFMYKAQVCTQYIEYIYDIKF